MDTDVIMPALGMAQQTGKVLAWHRRAGESVTRGEPLMEVETDKVTVAIEAPASGILAHVTAAPGDDVPVGQMVAVIQARTGETTETALARDNSGMSSRAAADALGPPASSRSPADAPFLGPPASSRSPADAPFLGPPASSRSLVSPSQERPRANETAVPPATPVAARLAAEHDLDLRLIAANGERIRKDDVLAHLDAAAWDRRLPAGPPFDAETGNAPGGVERRLIPGGIMNPAPSLGTARRVPASPKARRLAAERGVDVAALRGTGPGGAVLAADVLGAPAPTAQTAMPREQGASERTFANRQAAGLVTYLTGSAGILPAPASTTGAGKMPALPVRILAQQRHDNSRGTAISEPPDPATGADGDLIRPSGAGQLMARRTAESFRDTPHFYLTRELPARALMEARERLLPLIDAKAGVRLSFTDLLIRIMARTLAEHPLINASWHDGVIQTHARVNLGVAAATPQGLLVPVIHDAAGKNLSEIARARGDLARRAVAAALTPDDLAASTATLSNLGMYDVDMFQAIINPPNSMILAVGRIAERPVARDGAIVAAHTFWVTASFDHRIHDGARAAEFLRTFASYVEEPLALL